MNDTTEDLALETSRLLRALIELIVDRPADLTVDYLVLPAGRIDFRVLPNINDQGKVVGKQGAHVKTLKFLLAQIGEAAGQQFVLRLEQDDAGKREPSAGRPLAFGNAARYVKVLRELIDALFENEVEIRLDMEPLGSATEYLFRLYPMEAADYARLVEVQPAGEFQGQSLAVALATLFRAAGLRDGEDCRVEVPAR